MVAATIDKGNKMSEKIEVKIERMYPDVVVPMYKHPDDSGMDVRAYFSDEWMKKNSFEKEANDLKIEDRAFTLDEGGRVIIATGIRVAIPSGYEIQVRPRSGMAIKQGLTVLNTPGTVDAGYRGELGIIVYNTNVVNMWKSGKVTIKHGDRIAQIVLQRVPQIEWVEVDSVDNSQRGEGGFGSTGIG